MKNPKKPESSTKKSKSSDRLQKGSDDFSGSRTAEAFTPKTTNVEIKPAKGRPMLTWVGKKPLRQATAYPAQLVETFKAGGQTTIPTDWKDWPKDMPQAGLLFHGDNKDVLAYLLANGFRGKVKLIYIDPPFDSAADYVRKVALKGVAIKATIEGEEHSLGEQIQYTDIWANDNYLQFMYERLMLLKELLTSDGSIFVHCDHRKDHHLRFLLDEVFGTDEFVNELIWRSTTFTGSSKAIANKYPTNHNTIYWYSKSGSYVFNKVREDYKPEYLERFTNPDNDPNGPWQSVSLKTYSEDTFRRLESENRLIHPQTPGAGWRYKFYLKDAKGKVVETIWLDINMANSMASERTGYPTEKPDDLLVRIIDAHSQPGDLVLDCFLGSGTTTAVAQKLGRRWIGADINKGAIQTAIKRMQGVMQEQAEKAKIEKQKLPGMESNDIPAPAQLGFAVYRVNDYDLQIQHNEAFNLAVEHLGMTRSKTDGFFDGTLGKRLVKIVPFNHPVTALDLEEVKNELKARPEEERDIAVVGLGKEIAVEAWLEEWNKLRKQSNVPNKIEVIELRSDPKYGGFFTHEPAKAKVAFKKIAKGIEITINDFISPTILERLRQQNKDNPLFQPQVSDWRSMVDSVMIDADYDGKVFNITLADVPERKNDLVEGKYVVEAKKGARVAVKVTDMLGEEVLVINKVK